MVKLGKWSVVLNEMDQFGSSMLVLFFPLNCWTHFWEMYVAFLALSYFHPCWVLLPTQFTKEIAQFDKSFYLRKKQPLHSRWHNLESLFEETLWYWAPKHEICLIFP